MVPYIKVRLARLDGMSERAAALPFGIFRTSVKKIMSFSAPRGSAAVQPVKVPRRRSTVCFGEAAAQRA